MTPKIKFFQAENYTTIEINVNNFVKDNKLTRVSVQVTRHTTTEIVVMLQYFIAE